MVKIYLLLFNKVKDTISESKSQPWLVRAKMVLCCLIKSKIQFLKANHNKFHSTKKMWLLFNKVKDTISESKSQQRCECKSLHICCLIKSKIQFLKAIHNNSCISTTYTTQRNVTETVYTNISSNYHLVGS